MLRAIAPCLLILVLAAPLAAADARVMVYCDPGLDCGTSARGSGSCDPVFPVGTTTPCFSSSGDGTFAIGVYAGGPVSPCLHPDDCTNVVANLCYSGRLLGVETPNPVGDHQIDGERPMFRDIELEQCMPQHD